MQVHVAQHDADRTALWGSLLVWIDLAVFQDACLQPAPDQADHARIADAVLHEAEHPFVTETPEEILQVRFQHPAHFAAGDYLVEVCQGMVGSPFRTSAKWARQKIRLVDGRQHLGGAALERPVVDAGDAQRALFPLARLRDIHAPDVRCPISLAVNGSEHRLHPFPEGLLCISHGLAVHPWSRALRNLTQIRPYSFSCDVMGQGSEPQFWLTSCLRCYSFESCFHGWFIFSLHRSPDLSLDRAHVSPRTIHLLLTASPCSRLSRPRSTISQSDFHQAVGPSSPCQLVRSYRLSPEPDGSPLFP